VIRRGRFFLAGVDWKNVATIAETLNGARSYLESAPAVCVIPRPGGEGRVSFADPNAAEQGAKMAALLRQPPVDPIV
jgi:hypothetical protein